MAFMDTHVLDFALLPFHVYLSHAMYNIIYGTP
jgi:hypothetical protein